MRMSASEKTRRALREVGLTDYEIRAYLTLLSDGPMSASQISRSADLPYSKIYDVLSRLERKGWIEVEGGRPRKYYPKPPSEALEAARLRVESAFRDSEIQVLGELQPIYERTGSRERPDIWIVRGEFNILAKIRETLNKSQGELMLAVPTLPELLVETLATDLMHLRGLGVDVKLMITSRVDEASLRKLGKLADVRVRDQMFGGGLISDRNEVMLLLGEEKEAEQMAIWSDHIGLAKLAREYFEYLWRDAAPISL